MKAWSSDGEDLCAWLMALKSGNESGRQCGCEEHDVPSSTNTAVESSCCAVCSCKSVVPRASMIVPNTSQRIMRRLNLCSRHAPPEHMLGMVTSTRQFETIVSFYCNNKTARSGGAVGKAMG